MAEILSDLIAESMLIIGALGQGEIPSAEENADGLLAINNMLDRWNADRLNLFGLTDLPYTLIANTGSYTLGPTGSLALSGGGTPARPARIVRANIQISGLVLPVELYNAEQWATIMETSNVAKLPTVLYCDYAWPNAGIFLNPVPQVATATLLELFAWRLIAQFADTTADVTQFPPAYLEAMTYNLAVRLYPRFGIQPDPVVLQIAQDSKAAMRQLNAENGLIVMPSPIAAPPQQVQPQ